MSIVDTVGIILAAGKGTRMRSIYNETAKVCFKIFDKTLIEYVVDSLKQAGIQSLITIVGYHGEEVMALLHDKSEFVNQTEQKGTGHAVAQTLPLLKKDQVAIIVCGDTPLLTKETLQKLMAYHQENGNDATILEADVEQPFGYGRLVKNGNQLLEIVEEKDASDAIKKIKTINTGVYAINTNMLLDYIPKLTPHNAQNEYYLTQIFQLMVEDKKQVSCYKSMIPSEFLGINDRIQLASASKVIQKRINEKHMLNGITIVDPDTTYIGQDVHIGNDTIIYPNTHIYGKSIIGANCNLGPNAYIANALLQDCVIIKNAVVENQQVSVETKSEKKG